MNEDKKQYLSSYGQQIIKIRCLKKMVEIFPEKREEYIAQINKAKALAKTIEKKIAAVDGAILSEILCWKYICEKPISVIAENIGYSERHTERLLSKALNKLEI